MAKESIIIEFQINAKEALDNITQAREALVTLREEQKTLQKAMKDGTATEDMKKRFGELLVEIRELNGVINQNNKELQNQIKVQESAQGSLASYRAQIKNLKQTYSELSEEERNGAKGKELISKMDSLTNSAKAAEWQLQGVPKGLSKTVAAMSQVNFGAGRAAAGIAQLGKAFKALMANPIVLAIGAVVAVLKKLVDSFKKNDEAMTRLQKAMAPLKAVLSVIEKAFQGIVNVVSKVVEGIGNFASKLVSFIPGMDKYVKAQEDIVTATDNLEDAEREYAVESAKRQAQISELRNKSTESEKYTYEQRREFLKEAIELEKQEAEDKKVIAEEKLRIAQEEALGEIGYTQMTQEAWDKLSDEQKNTLTELQVAVTNTTTEFNNATRRMTSQLNAFDKQEKQQRQERAKAAAQAAKERAKNEKDALRELEDLTIEAIKSMQEKEIEQTKVATRRRIEDIQYRLKTEKNLTKTAKEALNREIVLLEAQLQVDLGEIDKRYTEDRLTNMRELYEKMYQELLTNKPDDIELQVRISDFGFETQILAIQKRNEEIKKLVNEVSGEEQIALENELSLNNAIIGLIEKNATLAATKIREEGMLATEAVKKANEEILATISDNKLLGEYWNNEVEKSRIFEEQARRRLQTAQDEVTRLKGLTEEQITALYGTEENYRNAVLNAENQVVLAQNNVEQAIRNTNKAIVDQQNKVIDSFSQIAQATGQVFGAFEDLFNNMAESDEKYAKYAKAMALMQVLVSTAISIANAIQGATAAAAATGPGAPIATPIFIAEMVAIVAGAIASAVGILKKADKPSKPKFAEGGLVGDQVTTRTDDSVEANLSVGEFVLRSAAVKSIGVENLNQMNATGMLPTQTINNTMNNMNFDWEQMKEVFVEAVADIHPVVSVKEITSVQSAVAVKEEIAKY
jgi:hypothetical protein